MIMPDKHFYLKIFILWNPIFLFLLYDMTCGFILSLKDHGASMFAPTTALISFQLFSTVPLYNQQCSPNYASIN